MMKRNMLASKPANLDIFELVNKITSIMNEGAKKKNITIINNINIGTFVHADVNMLQSIVQNLLINAVKFTQTEGKITLSSVVKNGYVEVSVQDTGIGIESEKLFGIFDLNTISSSAGTNGEKGTGLGLPLCKEFVEKNNGRIWG